MNLFYDSKTGNVERFICKLRELTDWTFTKITPDLITTGEFHYITYTTGSGQIPPLTKSFLQDNFKNMLTISVSGNRNWGTNFGKAGHLISNKYKIPLLMKFELSGTNTEVHNFIKVITNFKNLRTQHEQPMDTIK